MPYFSSGDDWLRESALLVQARPSTTRVTTRYNHAPRTNRTSRRRDAQRKRNPQNDPSAPPAGPGAGAGALVLKTFDPVSGACLQYRTDKGAEVGRLVGALGRLGRCMAGRAGESDAAGALAEGAAPGAGPTAVDESADGPVVEDGDAEVEGVKGAGHARAKKSVSFAEGPPSVQKAPAVAGSGGAGGGGGKKKKKGKK